MDHLALPPEQIQDRYAAVVIGSGYGGSIAASRLARAGQKVCVLERGEEILPGEYPETAAEVTREVQVDAPDGYLGSKSGLYQFHINPDLSVLSGCGLGGTSLINAGVSLRPEPRIFRDSRWPSQIRRAPQAEMEQYFRRAEEMLQPMPYPDNFPALAKLSALEKAAQGTGGDFYRAPINVTFKDGVNPAGIVQSACTLCGDCVTGCNYSAKNTLLMNYLPDARNHGVEIFTGVSVRHIERLAGTWKVHYQLLEMGRERFGAPTLVVSAGVLILAAGCLGTTEILLRSMERGLVLSRQTGQNLTSNGDVQAFAYNSTEAVNAIGAGAHPLNEIGPVGPCITGVIDARFRPDLNDGVVIEEGAVPGAIATLLPEVLVAESGWGSEKGETLGNNLAARERELESLALGPYHGATRNTLTYLVMASDDGKGRMFLKDDRLRIDWPGLSKQPFFGSIQKCLEQATQSLGGVLIRKSLSELVLHSPLITVHPLGGCIMAEDAGHGTVNHKGQVFCERTGNEVYDDLYVMDGSVIPLPLGVNPLLTISALSERAVELLASSRGWNINYQLPSAPPTEIPASKPSLRFTETMRGYFSAKVKDDYHHADEQGRLDHSRFEFTLTIRADEIEQALANSGHGFRIVGTAYANALSARPLTVTEGGFQLLVEDPENVDTRRMIYRMRMTSEEGRVFFFEGFKVIHEGLPNVLWPETTTLYITVYDGASSSSPVFGKGILRIAVEDFLRQLTTLRVSGAKDAASRLALMARFGRFFAGVLWDTYGGIVSAPHYLKADAPPRKKRPLRAPAPEVHFFNTEDNVQLRFLRYRGGNKGPVILTHGIGVSSLIFRIDTVKTNLVEFLVARGFDIWALDYRGSIELASHNLQFTADDVATCDYPAAVEKVRELTGAPSVQMVVHCFGSVSFFMAMLKGLKGVRSAVCSQVATHMVTAPLTELKCGLYIPEVFDALGVKSLNAYVSDAADWQGKLDEAAMRLYPMPEDQLCTNPVCHRITFMYSQVFEHQKLNEATHNALHEMFGATNIRAFAHLAEMVRTGHIVTASGDDDYLPHLERLAIPIAFISGGENRCFLPESTELTYNLLCEKNGKHLYTRTVVPHYGHADSILGKNAAMDVYPAIAKHLEATNG